MKYLSILSFFILLFVFSCTYENEEDLLIKQETFVDGIDSVSFSLDIQPLLIANCNQSGCHAAGTGPGRGDFSSYPGVKTKVDNGRFEEEVIIERTMPPNRNLSQSQINLLQSWIDQGALNN